MAQYFGKTVSLAQYFGKTVFYGAILWKNSIDIDITNTSKAVNTGIGNTIFKYY